MADASYQTQPINGASFDDDDDGDESTANAAKAAFSLEAKSNTGSVEVSLRSLLPGLHCLGLSA